MATAMTARRQLTREEWERRAVELARERHTNGTARVLAAESFRRVYGVRKGSALGEYIVLAANVGRVVCDCIAGQHGRPCSHAGAALLAEKARAEAMRQPEPEGPSEAWQAWMHGVDGEW